MSIMSGLGRQVSLSALPSLLLHHTCLQSTTGPGPCEPCLPQTPLLLGSDEPLGLGRYKEGVGERKQGARCVCVKGEVRAL